MKRHPFHDRLRAITREIVATYETSSIPAAHIGPERRLPSRRAIVRIIENLFAVLYPGFYGVQHLTAENVEYHVGSLLDDVAADLYEQACLAFRFEEPEGGGRGPDQIAAAADEAVSRFLLGLPEVRRLLELDCRAAMDGDPAARSFAEVVFAYPGFKAITIQRLAHEFWKFDLPLLARIMTEYAHGESGIDIHPGATIGESFFIDHGTGVVIGETTVIGSHVKLYQGVTLGALSFPKDARGQLLRNTKRHPTLCDKVVVYAGATILGGDTVIGEGAVIGGNTWVIESVRPGERVLNTKTSKAKQEKIMDRICGFGDGI
jgi:serine O-acetyltransferase